MSEEKKIICHIDPNWEFRWPTWARSLEDLLRFKPIKVTSTQELENIYPSNNRNHKETND